MQQLKQQIERHIGEADGTWAIALEDEDFQETWVLNSAEPFFAASIIKLPIMATVFALADRGQFRLGDTLVLHKEDQVGGCGVLQHMSPGIELSIYDVLTLMIIQSDNTATNMLIDLVSRKEIQVMMDELGMANSSFYTKLMTVPVNTPGRNTICVSDINRLLKRVVTGQCISLYACEQMISIMKKQQITNGFSDFLPKGDSSIVGANPKWEIASKSGNVIGIHHDAAIFYVGDRTLIVTVLSKECEREVARKTFAKIGKDIYAYMEKAKIVS